MYLEPEAIESIYAARITL